MLQKPLRDRIYLLATLFLATFILIQNMAVPLFSYVMRPMYIAVFSAFTGITGFIGPLVGGFIYKRVEDSPYWVQSYGISMFTGATLLIMALVIGPMVLKGKN